MHNLPNQINAKLSIQKLIPKNHSSCCAQNALSVNHHTELITHDAAPILSEWRIVIVNSTIQTQQCHTESDRTQPEDRKIAATRFHTVDCVDNCYMRYRRPLITERSCARSPCHSSCFSLSGNTASSCVDTGVNVDNRVLNCVLRNNEESHSACYRLI